MTREEHHKALDDWADDHKALGPFQRIDVDRVTLASVVACLQLSLRHPANNGHAAERARVFIDSIIERVGETHPVAAAALRLGDESMDNVFPSTPPQETHHGHVRENRN